jgi:predicted porin
MKIPSTKKILTTTAVSTAIATLVSFAGAAHAQSSVTLYGTLDTAVAWFSNTPSAHGGGKSTFMLSGGNLSPNLWGLKGTEELGNGLNAIFDIESGFNINTGNANQGGRMFGRQAYVGLSSNTTGTFTLGRQYDPLIDLLQPLTADETFGSVFATPGDMDNYDNSYRTNNSVKFTSPNYAGLQFSAMYGFGGEGTLGRGQTYAGAVVYNHGPLGIGAGYFRATNGSSTPSFDGLTAQGLGSCGVNCDSAVISGTFSTASSTQIVRAAADYTIGQATIGASYSNVQYRNYLTGDSSTGANRTSFNTGQVYVQYKATPALVLGLGYNYTKGSGNDVSVAYNQISLGADYLLSKRTDLYLLGGYQHASGKTYVDGLNMAALASMSDFGDDSASSNQGMLMVGIRHHF